MEKIKKLCDGCLHLSSSKIKPCRLGLPAQLTGKPSKRVIRPSCCKSKPNKNQDKIDYKKLLSLASDIFQTYIRYRDGWTCKTCGIKINPNGPNAKKLMQAGHYITRTVYKLLWDERNVYAQCNSCNAKQMWSGTITPAFTLYLVKTHGITVLEEFNKIYNEENVKPSKEQALEVIKKYKNKLLKEYGIDYDKISK